MKCIKKENTPHAMHIEQMGVNSKQVTIYF